MVIFINDRPVKLIEKKDIDPKSERKFDTVIKNAKKIKNIGEWRKKVLFPDADAALIKSFLEEIKTVKKFDFKSVTFWVDDMFGVQKELLSQYKLIDAAGGVVLNKQGKVLMMHRLGFWDLPKGKAEKGESIMKTAEREVNEECNIEVEVLDDFVISYHTYLQKSQRLLKRTYWYKMNLISDADMKPQKEENIDKLKWMDRPALRKALLESYASIAWVLDHVLSKELSFAQKDEK